MNTNTKSDFERVHNPELFAMWDEHKIRIIHDQFGTMCMLGEKPHRRILERPKGWTGPRFCRAIHHEDAADFEKSLAKDQENPFADL